MLEHSVARHRWLYLSVAVLTVLAGLSVRFAPLGLPWVVMKYGGSTLWAMMIYWVLTLVWPKTNAVTLAAIAVAIATLAELSRLFHVAWFDAFRVSLPGAILLGRYFSVRNIVAYWVAIIAAAAFDALVLRRVAVGALLESK